MISREVFDRGLDLVVNTFGKRITPGSRDVWYTLLHESFKAEDWLRACGAVIRECENFPANLPREMMGRRAARKFNSDVPISRDTGLPVTRAEMTTNLKRVETLMGIMEGRANSKRRMILACAEESLRQGDTPHALAQYGAEIVHVIDAEMSQ